MLGKVELSSLSTTAAGISHLELFSLPFMSLSNLDAVAAMLTDSAGLQLSAGNSTRKGQTHPLTSSVSGTILRH